MVSEGHMPFIDIIQGVLGKKNVVLPSSQNEMSQLIKRLGIQALKPIDSVA